MLRKCVCCVIERRLAYEEGNTSKSKVSSNAIDEERILARRSKNLSEYVQAAAT